MAATLPSSSPVRSRGTPLNRMRLFSPRERIISVRTVPPVFWASMEILARSCPLMMRSRSLARTDLPTQSMSTLSRRLVLPCAFFPVIRLIPSPNSTV